MAKDSNEGSKGVKEIMTDMGKSVSDLARSIVGLAKIGANKAQEAVDDYQKKGGKEGKEEKPAKAESKEESKEEPKAEPKAEKSDKGDKEAKSEE